MVLLSCNSTLTNHPFRRRCKSNTYTNEDLKNYGLGNVFKQASYPKRIGRKNSYNIDAVTRSPFIQRTSFSISESMVLEVVIF